MAVQAPGRLGDPSLNVATDPRTQPALAAIMKAMQLDGNQDHGFPGTDFDSIHAGMADVSAMIGGLYNTIPLDLPEDKNEAEIASSSVTIDGQDGHKIKLTVVKPKAATGLLPGIVYIHGGGMVINDTDSPVHNRWIKSLALQGTVAIMVDFRNAYTPEKYNPFPTGLNDCVAAVRYVAAHRADFGIDKFIVQGESGGANLSFATALRANREGWVDEIAGVYGYVPYISGGYGWSDERKYRETPSQKENEGYFLSAPMQAGMAWYYSPKKGELEDPLAWPYHATEADLKGLPTHAISVDELDGLRDDGIQYFRKLLKAGVSVSCDQNLGVVHGAALIFRQALPEVNKKQIRSVAAFAKQQCL
ncbi:Carboxylesterase NlhH [Pseudocercospora fuligena]|uniref:Carboxylesterase NlhH n=1 Tax=Pseudocercospora fuligena TaxID=685502 RepID=A0A8H6RDM7_9PEZI|nr:Carboxylesterase NlhH [Pseudocercospora fuligena]